MMRSEVTKLSFLYIHYMKWTVALDWIAQLITILFLSTNSRYLVFICFLYGNLVGMSCVSRSTIMRMNF